MARFTSRKNIYPDLFPISDRPISISIISVMDRKRCTMKTPATAAACGSVSKKPKPIIPVFSIARIKI